MKEKTIEKTKYKVNRGTLKAINEFKTFVGEDAFNQILQGVPYVDIPLEEEKYEELLSIILPELPSGVEDHADIPYDHAEELLSFFCEPFAGRYMRQAQSTLNTISSSLSKVDPKVLKTTMESIRSQNNGGTNSDAEN